MKDFIYEDVGSRTFKDIIKESQMRLTMNKIRIKNISNKDIKVNFSGYVFNIKAKKTAKLPRYLLKKAVKEILNNMPLFKYTKFITFINKYYFRKYTVEIVKGIVLT